MICTLIGLSYAVLQVDDGLRGLAERHGSADTSGSRFSSPSAIMAIVCGQTPGASQEARICLSASWNRHRRDVNDVILVRAAKVDEDRAARR